MKTTYSLRNHDLLNLVITTQLIAINPDPIPFHKSFPLKQQLS